MLKLINEAENIDSVRVEPVAAEEQVVDIVPEPEAADVETPEMEMVDPKVLRNACVSIANELITGSWEFIDKVNGLIATLDLDYREDNKGSIVEILNDVVDNSVISIGMLQKITNIMDTEKAELLNAGNEKASAIINNESEKVPE